MQVCTTTTRLKGDILFSRYYYTENREGLHSILVSYVTATYSRHSCFPASFPVQQSFTVPIALHSSGYKTMINNIVSYRIIYFHHYSILDLYLTPRIYYNNISTILLLYYYSE